MFDSMPEELKKLISSPKISGDEVSIPMDFEIGYYFLLKKIEEYSRKIIETEVKLEVVANHVKILLRDNKILEEKLKEKDLGKDLEGFSS